MSVIQIQGGRPLSGSVRIQGAKNSVLPLLAATLLSRGTCVLRNCPKLTDVDHTIDILRSLGCRVEREGDVVTVDSSAPTGHTISEPLMREMRSSVVFLGPILGRMGRAVISYPGGCELGPRPIDLHISALRTLGASITEREGRLDCEGGLTGGEIVLSIPSVGATENAMLSAVCAQGDTILHNAAREPEIVELQSFLNAMGARVRGGGTSTVTIRGGLPLHGAEHTVGPDRIVAATYLSALAASGGEGELTGVDWRQLSTVTAVLSEAGCTIRSGADQVWLSAPSRLRGARPVRTAPYPGFPTDAQAVVMAALCKGEGTTVFVENMFSSRYRHVDELVRMGADIRVEGKVAVVCGVKALHGAQVRATDLRGGAALAVAAVGAEGETCITGLRHIDRGYQSLCEDLSGLGARIVRLDTSTE